MTDKELSNLCRFPLHDPRVPKVVLIGNYIEVAIHSKVKRGVTRQGTRRWGRSGQTKGKTFSDTVNTKRWKNGLFPSDLVPLVLDRFVVSLDLRSRPKHKYVGPLHTSI